MKIKTPAYYKDFKCIGGSCIDTCCAGWEVDVDKNSSAYYKSVPGGFGDKLRHMLIDLPVEDQFQLQEHARCPFLNKDNLCDIFTELGEEHLCDTCTNFPRHITEFGGTREIGISLSCPVAVELIMKNEEKITFVTEETEEKISSYNDIDAMLYFTMMEARKVAIDICQDRMRPITERGILYLDFASKLQKKIKKPEALKKIIADYSKEQFLDKRADKLRAKKEKNNTENLLQWFANYEKLEHIKKEWTDSLAVVSQYVKNGMPNREKFDILIEEWEYEFEHLCVYYIFRYFLQSVFDEKVYEKAALGCIALIMQMYCGAALLEEKGEFTFEDQITLMRIYSKETEHSEENLAEIFSWINNEEAFSKKAILSLLLH